MQPQNPQDPSITQPPNGGTLRDAGYPIMNHQNGSNVIIPRQEFVKEMQTAAPQDGITSDAQQVVLPQQTVNERPNPANSATPVGSSFTNNISTPQTSQPSNMSKVAVNDDDGSSAGYEAVLSSTIPSTSVSSGVKTKRFSLTRRSAVVIAVVLLLVSAGGVGLYKFNVFGLFGYRQNSRPLDSPLGYIEGFDSIQSGRVRITTNYPVEINGDYDFFVRSDGRVLIDMAPRITKTNDFLDVLAQRFAAQSSQALSKEELASFHASRYMDLDLKSLYGYGILDSAYPLDFFSLYPSLLAQGKNPSREDIQALNPAGSASCVAAAKQLQASLAPGYFNTVNLPLRKTDKRNTYTIDLTKKQQINNATKDFTKKCYEDVAAAQHKTYSSDYDQNYDSLYKNTRNYTVTLTDKSVTMSLGSGDKKTTTTFRLLAGKPKRQLDKTAAIDSPFTTANRFALAYARCRNEPVMATQFTNSYVFDSSSDEYTPPTGFVSDYFCTTAEAEARSFNIDLAFNDSLDYTVGATMFSLSGQAIEQEKSAHNIAYYVEQFFVKHGYYPSLKDIASLTDETLKPISTLTDQDGKILNEGQLKYEPSPAGCSACKGYTLSSNYFYQSTNTPVSLRKKDFESN